MKDEQVKMYMGMSEEQHQANVQKAKENLKDVLKPTPLIHSDFYSNEYGCDIYVKPENLQITGSFKIRGAYNKIMNLTEEEALEWMKQEGFQPLHIEKLPDAKHIFSHVEWRMQAYLVKIFETVPGLCKKSGKDVREYPFLIVEREKIREEIAIPSAFASYRKYIYEK